MNGSFWVVIQYRIGNLFAFSATIVNQCFPKWEGICEVGLVDIILGKDKKLYLTIRQQACLPSMNPLGIALAANIS